MSTSLAAKIAAASKELGGRLRADARNPQGNYSYLSHNLLMAEAGQALAAQGVAVFTDILDESVTVIEGGKSLRYDARLKFAVTLTDGESERTVTWGGYASAYTLPDDALWAALSSGKKYFLAHLLNVGMEAAQPGRADDAPRPPAARPQPAPAPAPATDNPFTSPAPAPAPVNVNGDGITQGQLKMLHALGVQVYGPQWNSKRLELVTFVTKGHAESARELTKAQAGQLIDGLVAKKNATQAAEPLPGDDELEQAEALAF